MGRRVYLATAGLLTAAAMAWPAAATAALPDLQVSKVQRAHPPGTYPGGPMFVRATIANAGTGGSATPGRTIYLLSDNRRPGAADIRVEAPESEGGRPPLEPGASLPSGSAATVPERTDPGAYYLIACADGRERIEESREANNCTASPRRVAIQGHPSGIPGGEIEGAAESSPVDEYVPDSTWRITGPRDCPWSLHDQGSGKCVWVETPSIFPDTQASKNPNDFMNGRVFGLFYCPASQPYPFEVALGFDPLWSDVTGRVAAFGPAYTRTVSGTKYNVIRNDPGHRELYSYAGASSSPGYVYLALPVKSPQDSGPIYEAGRAQYLCSSRQASSYAP